MATQKWDKDYTVRQWESEKDDAIDIERLPPTTKQRVWAAIKAKNPERARAMIELKKLQTEMLKIEGELILSKTEYNFYMEQAK